jgi:hypothetical protein
MPRRVVAVVVGVEEERAWEVAEAEREWAAEDFPAAE